MWRPVSSLSGGLGSPPDKAGSASHLLANSRHNYQLRRSDGSRPLTLAVQHVWRVKLPVLRVKKHGFGCQLRSRCGPNRYQ